MREHGGVSPPLEMLRGPLLPPGTDFRLLQEARPARHPGAGQPQGQVRRGKLSPGTFTTDPGDGSLIDCAGRCGCVHGYSCDGAAGRCVQEPEFATGGLAPLTVAQVTAASSLGTGYRDLALTRWAACPRSDSAPPSSRTGRGCPVSALLRVGAVSSASPSDAIRGEGREG